VAFSQKKTWTPTLELCDCRFKIDSEYLAIAPAPLRSDSIFQNKIDSSFKTQCGYLIVPENRNNAASKNIKLPFIIVKSKNPNKKNDPVLFTSGGPGNSSLGWANGITKSTLLLDRDCIAFEQRGTRFAVPYLRRFDLDNAIREAYRKNLPKDSMVIEGVKRYKKNLETKGIDLSGYNTDETVADISNLLTALHIDSVNLLGGSYSGGLMLAVLQNDSTRVRSLVLDSPLPMFVPIDEDEPANLIEALNVLFNYVERDSTNKAVYGNLKEKFHRYFTSIANKTFYFPYLEKGTTDTLRIQYTKNELLEYITNSMLNHTTIKDVPSIITEMIQGRHSAYIKKKLDDIFNKYTAPDGMRMTVYCADQAAYHNEDIIHQLYTLYPYLAGYRINDVYKAMCDCWNVPPVKARTKQPFYSNKPVLTGDGEMDPACRPLYMKRIQHYMPNCQSFLFLNRSHGVSGKEFFEMTQKFIDNPHRRIESNNTSIIAY
jgi:pimeloyl-ACP methyl ester carboxylesterase